MTHSKLFVFDIETIPDTAAVANLLPDYDCANASEKELRQVLADYHIQITDGKSDFLRQPFHRVVAISFLSADIVRDGANEYYKLIELRSGGDEFAQEKELLQGFFHYLSKGEYRLVSFNGRTFDLPVLKYRAMAHGVSAKWLYQLGDKWNSYQSRYSLDWHCDLLEALSDFGASARVKLDEVCSVMGFPGKFGIDGSKVASYVDEGKEQDIRDYCETDVLNTYLVYLRYMYHRGVLTTAGYNQSIEDILAMINTKGSHAKHLQTFKEAWMKASGGNVTLA